MIKLLFKLVLKLIGWKIKGVYPGYERCVVVVAPHTSFWDFIIGKFYYLSIGLKTNFLIKKELFFFPFGQWLSIMGAIPVDRSDSHRMVFKLSKQFAKRKHLVLTITPEGTRKKVDRWRRGFYYIAEKSKVPVVMGYIDYKTKTIGIIGNLEITGDVEADMKWLKQQYKGISGKHADQFSIGENQ